MYKDMIRIRRFEETVSDLFSQDKIRGTTHLYIGEEAVAVGACNAIHSDDYITSTHRGHGHCIAKGATLREMMAELFGKMTGYCKGKGGSLHIADLNAGNLGANGIVGGGIPIATGSGLTSKYKKTGKVTVCFFGDGASNTGAFHEAVNMAATWKLPVVFVCENNLYAMSTPVREAFPILDIAERGQAYGMPGIVVDGMDVLAVMEAVEQAAERARRGEGPTLIECKTYRYLGHSKNDPRAYRTKDEEKQWKERDAIKRFRKWLLENTIATEEEIQTIDEEVENEITEAVEFADSSPYPPLEEIVKDVYVEEDFAEKERKKGVKIVLSFNEYNNNQTLRNITYRDALNEALREELNHDSNVVLIGEDIGLYGGAYGVTRGLWQDFGDERVRNTPISEAAIIGCCVGAAITGLRPVGELMYVDFAGLAMDQIYNQGAKIRYMFGGKALVPMVIRTEGGCGRSSGAHHAQSLEAWFMHVPGLKVVMPATPFDAKGLLKSAIREDNPIIFIEHKMLYNTKGLVPEDEYLIPIGVADVKKSGTDVTVIAYSRMLLVAMEAAEMLEKEGIHIEIIDPRTLLPLDIDTIVTSVKKTGKVIIVSEACKTGGPGGEIGMQIIENAFYYLDAPLVRLGAADAPVPCSRYLEDNSIPQAQDVVNAVKGLLE
ncbi:MAG: pyruvate dehydrogenase (acetyl-transferring) E1 component subunit alpha [Candidatus Atribacteria bacterium]|nr:pyruvate dehydrogenase (acetyl-transferring) E1 component subunit alpha [Candidatus Atribacteria bacterium]